MNDTERARLIATLTHLKVPFDRKQISKLPATQGRPALDYVNHAHVTARLNAQAEDWTYTVDEQFTHGGQFWIRGTMTICGVSRVEYGQGKNPLEAASHFVRRAAMRFGVAVDLWAKEDLETSWGEPVATASSQASSDPGAQPAEDTAGSEGGRTVDRDITGKSVVDAPSDPAPLEMNEPHQHIAGPKKLASGKALCVYEFASGKVCGAAFRPEPVSA